MSFNVAIDGPAGAGKSTVAKTVAGEMNFIYVDTGAMYRAMALYFLREGIDPSDEAAVSEACRRVSVTISYEAGVQQVFLNGENVSGLIRTEEVGNMASATSGYRLVREKLVELQKELAKKADVIMDGRDIGTCVLPEADVKIYLTAGSLVRAKRRYKELTEKGISCNLEEIERDIIDRDYRDMHRENSPLSQAEDAVLLDSSDMTLRQVVETIEAMVREKEKHRAEVPQMEVIVAKTAGFCFGVKRAVEKVYEQIGKTEKPIYTYGPIIHNEEVVKDLPQKGCGGHRLPRGTEGRQGLRRGHPLPRSRKGCLPDPRGKQAQRSVDATCPYVKKIHRIVEEQSKAGRQVLIVGDAAHPEVQGIRGWGDSGTKVIENDAGFPRFAASGGQQALHRGPDDI